MTWRYHTPERDGHAPDDWVEGMECELETTREQKWMLFRLSGPHWISGRTYRYRPLQDATVEPSFDTLKDQCLRLPQDQREALIEAMQKPTLLPCPFCGETPKGAYQWGWHGEGLVIDKEGWCVRHNCRHGHGDSEAEAIASWNRRAS